VVFLDAIVAKVRDNQVVQNKRAYIAIGIDADGKSTCWGFWLATTAPEAKFIIKTTIVWTAAKIDRKK
jgi:transposase-like protein